MKTQYPPKTGHAAFGTCLSGLIRDVGIASDNQLARKAMWLKQAQVMKTDQDGEQRRVSGV
ncbi:hypothetical protein BKI51_10210 [Alphaproteobacteria bacterium AO1-B]|nr:hypothetical protein BKI51_10210 [Alphaproteobacteria bacterium AO1-B]